MKPRRMLSRTISSLIPTVLALGLLGGCSSSDGSADAGPDRGIADGAEPDRGQTDGGTADAQAADAGTGDGPAPDAQAASPIPLPIYRIGPRSVSGGSFSKELTGSLALPKTTKGFGSFEGWQISGHGFGGADASIGATTEQGDQKVATFSATVPFAFADPIKGRELFTARSADESLVLLAVLADDGTLSFTVEATARQALSLAGIRKDVSFPAEETYYSGLAAGDDPALDAKVAGVAAAMTQRLEQEGDTGITWSAGLLGETKVFDAVDQAVADPALKAPSITPPASPAHLGTITVGGSAGTVDGSASAIGIWPAGAGAPLPVLDVPAGSARIGFFFYTVPISADVPFFARLQRADGRHAPATALQKLGSSTAQPPDSPTLEVDEAKKVLRACQATAPNRVVLFSAGTELAVGFVALEVGSDGCAEHPLTDVPNGVSMVFAIQVTEDLRYSAPTPSAFF